MPSTTTQKTREVQINKKEATSVKQSEQPQNNQSVFSSGSWDDDFNRLHGRLLTSFDDKLWPRWTQAADIMTAGFGNTDSSNVSVKNEGDVFQVTVESADFRPEELKVTTLNDNLLKIEGRHVEEGSTDNGNKYVSRQFSRYDKNSAKQQHIIQKFEIFRETATQFYEFFIKKSVNSAKRQNHKQYFRKFNTFRETATQIME